MHSHQQVGLVHSMIVEADPAIYVLVLAFESNVRPRARVRKFDALGQKRNLHLGTTHHFLLRKLVHS